MQKLPWSMYSKALSKTENKSTQACLYNCTNHNQLSYLIHFLFFPACFWIPTIFSNLNSNCSNLFDVRNLQIQVKAFCYQKLIWSFTVWINCSSDWEKLLKFETEGREFAKILRSLEQFILTVKGQNNFR